MRKSIVIYIIICTLSMNLVSIDAATSLSCVGLSERSTLAPQLLITQKIRFLSNLLGESILQFCQISEGLKVVALGGFGAGGKTSTAKEVKKYLKSKGDKNVVVINYDWFIHGFDEFYSELTPYLERGEVLRSTDKMYNIDKFNALMTKSVNSKNQVQKEL